ncbi:MAG: AAA family ATPase [Paludibacteraceae bacterium]|nr:AAA family ATPase [Paludibacteraceae bacterium]
MEQLINKCSRKLQLTQTDYVRSMMNTIGWGKRLIALRGAKGVGKTTLMLQYLKMHHCDLRTSLYVSVDDAYFVQHSLVDFVAQFYNYGGKLLMLDEVHKYPGWSRELKNIYDDYPDLSVVVSASSLLNLMAGDADLSRRCVHYDIFGLSFREYMQLVHHIELPMVTLEDLLNDSLSVCQAVTAQCHPLAYFDQYLSNGYYPFVLEGSDDYLMKVENVVHYMLNVELPQLRGVEVAQVRKLLSLLAVLSSNVPLQVDITKLSAMIEVSRQTLLGYLQHLSEAKLLNLLYSDETSVKKLQKPDKIYLENPNLMEALTLDTINVGTRREAFLLGQLRAAKHRVEYTSNGDFLVDGKWTIEVGGASKGGKQIANLPNGIVASDGIELSYGNKLPLWLFGLLY